MGFPTVVPPCILQHGRNREGNVMGDVIRNDRFRRQTARQRARMRERLARRRPWEMENVREPGRITIAQLPLRRERRR